jgi:transposase
MKTAASSSPRRYARFCGIDIAKNKHVACVIDRDGDAIVKSQTFNNDAAGYQLILGRLQEAGGPRRVAVAMEATGHYWYGVHDFLTRQGYEVAVLNPLQTAQQAKKGIRKTQTDRIDARHIAVLLKNGDGRAAIVPGELGMTCRQLSRLYYTMVGQEARIKQLVWTQLHPIWPEYEPLFANPFCKTSRALLQTAATPQELLDVPEEALHELIRKTSRGKYGPAMVEKIRQAAENSVGTRRGLEAARANIRLLLDQIEALRPIRQQLESNIHNVADRLPAYLLTLPGISSITAVSLFGETDPVEAFSSPGKLVAFAGLDPVVLQSGQPTAQDSKRHISKRGSPFLRKTLWAMSFRALQKEGELRDYWLRKRRTGAHHFAAVIATTIKLCHVVWRIMIDRRDYLPQRPVTKA